MSAIQIRCEACGGEYLAGVVGRTPWPAHECPARTQGGRIAFNRWAESVAGDYCKVPAGRDPRNRQTEVWYIRDPAGRAGALTGDRYEFTLAGRKLTVTSRRATYGMPTIMGEKWCGELHAGVWVEAS